MLYLPFTVRLLVSGAHSSSEGRWSQGSYTDTTWCVLYVILITEYLLNFAPR